MLSWSAEDWARLIGATTAYLIIYGGLLWLGHIISRWLTRRRDDRVVVRWPYRIAFGLVVVLLLGQCSKPKEAKSELINDRRAGIVVQKTVMARPRGWPDTFTPQFVREYNRGLYEGFRDTLRRKDASIDPKSITVSTNAVSLSGRAVLKSKMQSSARLFGHAFAGATGQSLIQISYYSRTARPFDPAGTACERTVAKTFGAID